MLKTIVLCFVLLLPAAAFAPSLPQEDLFALYARHVPQDVIATRLGQLYTNLPAGAFKDTARAALIQDLLDILESKRLRWMASQVTPLIEHETDVGETTLP